MVFDCVRHGCYDSNPFIIDKKEEIDDIFSILDFRYYNNYACGYDWHIDFYKDDNFSRGACH
ncbi:MAG: hypothetical protein KAT32_01555 [Candidatus Moranbacteria bacterium]|nr:hypothetical protein [Candidatus Moranbacteria bacterium]